MGNDTCTTFPQIYSKDFQLPDLHKRNTYGTHRSEVDDSMVKAIFAQSENTNRNNMIIKQISDSKDKRFTDLQFAMDQKISERLSVMYNFKSLNARIYTKTEDTDITYFIQTNIELTYLTSVFYLLCKKQAKNQLLKNIIETQEVNNYGAYSLKFYCNGEPHHIIVDDILPVKNDSFIYLRIDKGKQLWPLILQKAWCKMIGSYEKARGLSPEDAFEQITGIPAYTYTIDNKNRNNMKQILRASISRGYWVGLVAKIQMQDVYSKQVFSVVSLDERTNVYRIISAFTSFAFDNCQKIERGQVWVEQNEIFQHFDYIIVGFYKKGYALTSEPVDCKSHEELIYKIQVKTKQDISIRFNQFYAGYLSEEERNNYKYSSVMMELYKVNRVQGSQPNYQLLTHSQGCNHSFSGVRSSECSLEIFQQLVGQYLLRLQIDWEHQSLLHRGNLVIYSTESNVLIQKIVNNNQFLSEIYPCIMANNPDSIETASVKQNQLEIKTFHKLHSSLMEIKNVSFYEQEFKVQFEGSVNLLVRGCENKASVCNIKLDGEQTILLELLPLKLKETMEVKNLVINKVGNKK